MSARGGRPPLRTSAYMPVLVILGAVMLLAFLIVGFLKVSTDGVADCGSPFQKGTQASLPACADKRSNRSTLFKGLGVGSAACFLVGFALTVPGQRNEAATS